MPLNLSITPVAAPTLTGLTVTATLKGILIAWDALQDATLFATEIWVSATNDRTTATLLATVTGNYYLHTGLTSNVARYYWVRAKNTYNRTDGAWTPVSATAGASTTTLMAQTADLNPNAATSVGLFQSATALIQTAYATWEQVFSYKFYGTGNAFILDVQHLTNFTVTTIGTSQKAYAQQRLELIEYTVYNTGTSSVTNGSAVVTGAGTTWVGNVVAGNVYVGPDNVQYSILSVDSNGQITLTAPYAGATLSGQSYYIVTASAGVSQLTDTPNKLEINGTYCLSHNFQFGYRFPFTSVAGKLYEYRLLWALFRDNTTWDISQSSTLKTLITEEIKR